MSTDQDVCRKVVSSIHDREAAPMKSPQYGFLNKTHTVAIPADMPA